MLFNICEQESEVPSKHNEFTQMEHYNNFIPPPHNTAYKKFSQVHYPFIPTYNWQFIFCVTSHKLMKAHGVHHSNTLVFLTSLPVVPPPSPKKINKWNEIKKKKELSQLVTLGPDRQCSLCHNAFSSTLRKPALPLQTMRCTFDTQMLNTANMIYISHLN